MRKIFIFCIGVLILFPFSASAKSFHSKGYEHQSGKEISITEPLGWPVKVKTSVHMSGSMRSFPGMVVIRLKPYNPWWRFFKDIPRQADLILSGFPAHATLHLYTRGYRDHQFIQTDANGLFTLSLSSQPGNQLIIKASPSTHHITAGGGDCNKIGTWSDAIATCTLTKNSDQTIAIEDSNITLDGAGHTLIGTGTGDGVYTDMSNVTIKNLQISGFSNGITFSNALLTSSSNPLGGTISDVVLVNESNQIFIDGIGGITIQNVTMTKGGTGIWLIEQGGYKIIDTRINDIPLGIFFGKTKGATLSGVDIRKTTVALQGTITDTVTISHSNFIDNEYDVYGLSGGPLQLNMPDPLRGNYWQKNILCVQQSTYPNYCADSYITRGYTDAMPWACENGWKKACPYTPLPTPTPKPSITPVSGEWAVIKSDSGSAKLYMDQTPNDTRIHKTLPNGWVLKVIDSSSSMWKVEDVSDHTIGWVRGNEMVEPGTNELAQQKAEITLEGSISERKQIIWEAIKHYYADTATPSNLYSGRNGGNKFDILAQHVPKELFLGIASQESEIVNYDNSWVAYDVGLGVMQLTSKGLIGKGTLLNVPSCDEKSEEDTCWEPKQQLPLLNQNSRYTGRPYKVSYRIYVNSIQSVYANIKDGMRAFLEKYIVGQKRFANPPAEGYKAITTGSMLSTDMMKVAFAVRAYNGLGSCPTPLYNEQNEGYLKGVATHLGSAANDFTIPTTEQNDISALKEALVVAANNQQFFILCSPVYLQIIDNQGKMTGFDGNQVVDQLPEVVYDYDEHKYGSIILPLSSYKIRVVGTDTGTYTFPAGGSVGRAPIRFTAINIPTMKGSVHEYSIDWRLVEAGKKGVQIRIDQDGDRVFESENTYGAIFTAEDFSAMNKKVTICHVPSGNPGNTHTLSISRSALDAHLKHGDHEGECKDSSKKKEDKKKEDKPEDKKDSKKEKKK